MISALSNQAETGRGGQLASCERNSDKLSLDCHNPDGDGVINYSRKGAKAADPSSPGTAILLKNTLKIKTESLRFAKKFFSMLFNKGIFSDGVEKKNHRAYFSPCC